MKRSLILTFILLTLSCFSAFGWGKTGHRIVAQIAEQNLSKSAKKKINRLLDNYPMAYYSNRADEIKSDTTGQWEHTFIWHYVNIPSGMQRNDFEKAVYNVKQDNLYSELVKLEETLKSKESTDEQKRIALCFIIHLVGDMHQPMHVGREDDLGGNRIYVEWFSRKTNIHAVWDSDLIDLEKYSYTEYASILNILPENQKNKLTEGSLMDWLYETYLITTEIYSSINKGDQLSYNYQYKYKKTLELQLQRAGLRLASILNNCL
jgi:hypothetical protein